MNSIYGLVYLLNLTECNEQRVFACRRVETFIVGLTVCWVGVEELNGFEGRPNHSICKNELRGLM